MKKPLLKHLVQDQVGLDAYPTSTKGCHRTGASCTKREHQEQSFTRRRFRYSTGEAEPIEPTKLPRLFVRGGVGSVKVDLSGFGTRLSPHAYAYRMPDDSLLRYQVRQGDIALVDQAIDRALRHGDFLMCLVDGEEIIRRLVNRQGLFYLQNNAGRGSKMHPLWESTYLGVVLGFLRLYADVRPVRYRPAEQSYDGPIETSDWSLKLGESKDQPKPATSQRFDPKSGKKVPQPKRVTKRTRCH